MSNWNRNNYLKKNPWMRHFWKARERCNWKKHHYFHRYGGRGIKFMLTQDEIKSIWLRDKAWLLKEPSIDRIDNDGHYELSNCRFIERKDNKREAKLSVAKVLKIRELLKSGISYRKIANKFGCDNSLIYQINNGKAWSYVK